ncbi:cytosolic iron-sulfur assembly component 1 isoform X2 [Megalopta genalis]|uniref:cytosolic iron-sulfur assembly component 1 isoform X2 n=1 Tax=Megalopta genalis TaxID=115081 RepID=UPI0014431095|nr:NIF3-like protein 1 isoform X2 [Megalopta genalis]XP_033340686.1 NIF3-like protein 1 isoform X2 [Megalopta genalis]XP_033340687.1 NIF3-like protein 1 isoform X2 [Megalopta genalis]
MFRHLIGLGKSCKTLASHYKLLHTMGEIKPSIAGVPLTQVVDALNGYAELSLAASWDNVGLLIEPTDPKLVFHILLTNDLTEDVMQEAINLKSDMIITYHPLIFAPMKSVTTRSWKEKIVAKCLENKIAVYSPHTSFDSVKGGVNDWLASSFHSVLESSKPIEANSGNKEYGFGRLCTLKKQISIEEAVELVKKRTGLSHVRLARARQTNGFINTIALCAGSGATVLKDIPADLYLTGEMLHHDVLDAVHKGVNVILTNHSDSERGFLSSFSRTLLELLNGSVVVSVSKADADPLTTV